MQTTALYVLSVAGTALAAVVWLFLLTRLMGKRQMAQLSMFDYINGITIGSIAAEAALSGGGDIWPPLAAMTIFALVAICISLLSNRSLVCRRLLVGKPVVLFENDRLYEKNLAIAKLDVNEFLTCCRSEGYFDLSDIETAILETNGMVSFLPKAGARPATPDDLNLKPQEEAVSICAVIDGEVMDDCLKSGGYDREWLRCRLAEQKVKLQDVILATADPNGALTVFERTGSRVEKRYFI